MINHACLLFGGWQANKWCTAVYSLSLLFCQFSSNIVSSPVYYSTFVFKNFPLFNKKINKRLIAGCAWSRECAWWLAFLLHLISLFSFFCFDLPITRPFSTSLEGSIYRELVDCRNQGAALEQRVKHGNWRRGNSAVDMVFYFLGRGRGNCILFLPS